MTSRASKLTLTAVQPVAGVDERVGLVPQTLRHRCRGPRALANRRHGAEEEPRVRVCRLPEDRGDRAELDQPAAAHHTDPVDELRLQCHVVPDQDHRHPEPLLHTFERLGDRALDDDVERARRFVGDDDLRPERDRHRDADALLHAAAELVRVHANDT
jgi:hypothetical protein